MSGLTEQLEQQLITDASRPLMQDATKHWYTGKQLKTEKNIWKTYWKNKGIGNDDVVLLSLTNSVTYSLVTQSLWEIGAIVHTIDPQTTEIQISELEDHYNYSALVLNENIHDLKYLNMIFTNQPRLATLHEPEAQIFIRNKHIAHLSEEPEDDQLALIMHTSGTTGKPKRVGLTHQQILAGANNIIQTEKLTAEDKTLVIMPMFHINALVISNLATRLSHGQLLFREKFSAHNFWSDVSHEQITWISLTPAILAILLRRDEEPTDNKLRFLRTSSAPLLPSTHDKFDQRFNIPLVESYGMTEAAGQIAQNPLDHPIRNTVGTFENTDLQILDSQNRPLSTGQVGQIAIKGDSVIKNYLDPQPESFHDGYLLTGDLGSVDENKYLHIAGRSKEMIIRGGENVNPLTIENCLVDLKFIKEIAVVGIPDPIYGETVAAVIVPNIETKDHRHQIALLDELANEQLLPVERPTKYIFSDELPKNATKKVQRARLAEIVAQQLKEA
ncbi:AMP-binding protein [Companilactobacillus versmoldensis]|uniref:Acetyl-CoA synthetase n=1 Tax=Companilactobacillus versmoldensis DSM 14857 = KCTC 3814 TaxID=1423815 RepID=A0A0R1SA06_9LACO|nr:AMP-binding protein [Companilactobacillus versmoldensis]KRL65887.1 acetyl-CoA synthetase [Companilactobacillus versmoldensis DSM 14857 = KCTC 3814]